MPEATHETPAKRILELKRELQINWERWRTLTPDEMSNLIEFTEYARTVNDSWPSHRAANLAAQIFAGNHPNYVTIADGEAMMGIAMDGWVKDKPARRINPRILRNDRTLFTGRAIIVPGQIDDTQVIVLTTQILRQIIDNTLEMYDQAR